MNIYKLANYLEVKYSHLNISDEMQYHIDNGLGMDKNVFKPGSDMFCKLFKEMRNLVEGGTYNPNESEIYFLTTDIGDIGNFEGKTVPLDLPMFYEEGEEPEENCDCDCEGCTKNKEEDENDAKYQGKDVELNKPKRGGSKKFYVYVKDGDKVKKVSFGDPGMSMRISDPEARKSFKARHDCENKNDKTKAGYWSCRIGRYPNLTGAKQKYTWW